jgi:hypothetical protein
MRNEPAGKPAGQEVRARKKISAAPLTNAVLLNSRIFVHRDEEEPAHSKGNTGEF